MKMPNCLTCCPETPWLAARRCRRPGPHCWRSLHSTSLSPEPRCRPSASHFLQCEAGNYGAKKKCSFMWDMSGSNLCCGSSECGWISTWRQRLCSDHPWHCWASLADLSGYHWPPHTAKSETQMHKYNFYNRNSSKWSLTKMLFLFY